MIITGELAPGTIVSEAHLADLLKCSRTLLRKALQQLSHHYLVETPPRRGVVIPELSIVEFQEAHEAILFLESVCIRTAARQINDEQLEQMKEIVAQQQQANEVGQSCELIELDYRFHILMAEAAHNRYLRDWTGQLRDGLARFVYRAYKSTGSAALSIAEHGQIVEALERRDGELAQQRVREHIIKARQRLLNILGVGDES
jgi:DNA-binding GntR family transcriptional regulator